MSLPAYQEVLKKTFTDMPVSVKVLHSIRNEQCFVVVLTFSKLPLAAATPFHGYYTTTVIRIYQGVYGDINTLFIYFNISLHTGTF